MGAIRIAAGVGRTQSWLARSHMSFPASASWTTRATLGTALGSSHAQSTHPRSASQRCHQPSRAASTTPGNRPVQIAGTAEGCRAQSIRWRPQSGHRATSQPSSWGWPGLAWQSAQMVMVTFISLLAADGAPLVKRPIASLHGEAQSGPQPASTRYVGSGLTSSLPAHSQANTRHRRTQATRREASAPPSPIDKTRPASCPSAPHAPCHRPPIPRRSTRHPTQPRCSRRRPDGA